MLFDFVLENVTTPGTGTTVSLAGAVTGRKSFAQATTTGSPTFYYLDDGTQAEWGYGVFTTGAPNTVSRATVIGNTAGTTSRLNFTGTTRIYNSLPASRAIWLDANLAKTSGMIVNNYDAGGLNYRAVSGNYGAGWRNDGTLVSLLSTASGAQYSSYNSLRPFFWNLSTGAVNIDNTGAGATFGGSITASSIALTGSMTASSITLTGSITAGNAINIPNNIGIYAKDTGGTYRPMLSIDTSNNTTLRLAASAAYWRVVNFANTASIVLLDDSGNLQVGGNVKPGIGGSGGYYCKQGKLNAASTNVFNFYWDGTYFNTYIDATFTGAITMVSDERYKHAVAAMPDGALGRIMSLRPVQFRWQDRGIFRDDQRSHEGMIAQEVRDVIPDAVTMGGADETLALSPIPLIAVLVKAVQELRREVDAVRAELVALKGIGHG